MRRKSSEAQIIFIGLSLLFIAFLFAPLIKLFVNSFNHDGSGVFLYYRQVLSNPRILESIGNSIKVSVLAGIITTILAFFMAYGINYTNINKKLKHWLEVGITLPMLLPTITYGFAIIYSFGKQGLLTKLFGFQIFPIYGFGGLLLGYVIYTLPIVFLLMNNSFYYIDKKFMIVSKLMGDGIVRSFTNTILRPMIGTIGGGFLIAFVLSFTDFGIPASLGGSYRVIAMDLYQVMLGAIPDFNQGSAIAVLMLIPSVIGIIVLNYLERYNFHYNSISKFEILENRLRDGIFKVIMGVIVIGILAVFLVIFITPFVENYPYDMRFTLKYFRDAVMSNNVLGVFRNSIFVASCTAILGTVIAFLAALINVRTPLKIMQKKYMDLTGAITNSVPGMVLGLAYLFLFKGTDFKQTFLILIMCNIVHFFTTPYLMAKNSLSKMNPSWEITGELMGDSWFQTIFRVVVPNSKKTIVEMLSYFFIQSMITISAIIFLVTASTAVVTSKIKELQYYGNFNEIFILSILIFGANMLAKIISKKFINRS